MAKAKRQGAPEFVDDMGEVQPIGRKGGSRSDTKNKSNKNKKKK